MKGRFRLQSVLDLRVAAEEQQKRRVQLASISLARSTEARKEAEQWIARSNESLVSNAESTTEAEICFALDCVSMGKKALAEHSIDHRRLVEQLECEIRKLDGDHRRTAIVETLRDQYLKEMQAEERRSEQLSLDESFRLSANSRLGISKTVEKQD